MGGLTPNLKIPYPTGSDRVADGDNAMQAIAERLEARLPYGFIAEATYILTTGGITIADLITTSVTVPAGRRIKITALATVTGTTPSYTDCTIYVDNVSLSCASAYTASGSYATLRPEWAGVPSAGAHTVKLQVAVAAGTITTRGDAGRPMFLRFEDIGPAAPGELTFGELLADAEGMSPHGTRPPERT